MAMAAIERSASSDERPTISNAQKEQFMEAAKTAIIGAARWLPSTVSDGMLVAGLRGVLHQIACWDHGRDNASDFSLQAVSMSAAQARMVRSASPSGPMPRGSLASTNTRTCQRRSPMPAQTSAWPSGRNGVSRQWRRPALTARCSPERRRWPSRSRSPVRLRWSATQRRALRSSARRHRTSLWWFLSARC